MSGARAMRGVRCATPTRRAQLIVARQIRVPIDCSLEAERARPMDEVWTTRGCASTVGGRGTRGYTGAIRINEVSLCYNNRRDGMLRTERICIGVCTTISNSFRLPECGSTDWSSPRSTRKTILSMCVTKILLRRLRFVKWRSKFEFSGAVHGSGRCTSVRIRHGPGPIRLEAYSLASSPSGTSVARGERANACGSSGSSGRSGGPSLSFCDCLRASSGTRMIGSVRAMRRKSVQ